MDDLQKIVAIEQLLMSYKFRTNGDLHVNCRTPENAKKHYEKVKNTNKHAEAKITIDKIMSIINEN